MRKMLGAIGGEGFNNPDFPFLLLLKCFLIQKVFGFNRFVSWPVHWSSKIKAPKKIHRGNRCPGLSMGCYIDGRNGIVFGSNVWIGPRVSVISMNHDPSDYHSYIESGPVIIGENCWLGANAVILPEVELGEHTVVAAGAVVTKSFKEGNQVLAGVPARVVKKLDRYRVKP
jgi:acetyltransferase-like isoleucine patch superfamily enzyme